MPYQNERDKILEVFNHILKKDVDFQGNFPKVGKMPRFSDSGVTSSILAIEYLLIDVPNLSFEKPNSEYLQDFPHLINRIQYNRRTIFFI